MKEEAERMPPSSEHSSCAGKATTTTLFLPFHIHLPTEWNFIILYKLFISLLLDLVSKAVAVVKVLQQWLSHQNFVFYWWEVFVWEYIKIFPSTLICFLSHEISSKVSISLIFKKKKILTWFVLIMRKLWIREHRWFAPRNTLPAGIWGEIQTNPTKFDSKLYSLYLC